MIHILLTLVISYSDAAGANLPDFGLDGCASAPEEVRSRLRLIPPQFGSLACQAQAPPKDLNYLGPNCFAGVIHWFQPSQPLEFVGAQAFRRFLRESFIEISSSEARAGDVLTFEKAWLRDDPDLALTHAAVMVEDGVVWNKLGPAKYSDRGGGLEFRDPSWTFSTLEALEKQYEGAEIRAYRRR